MNRENREWIDRAVDWLDKMELWGMTLITKVIAIITPIPVALQTRKHAGQYLDYETGWAWVLALIVEFLGYSAIYKSLQFAEHNRRYTDPKNHAPFKLAIGTYVFYLVAVIVFNVIPEIATGQEGYKVAMNIVLALFSVPGGVIAGISAIFTERKAAMKRRSSGTSSETTFETPLPKRVPKPLPEVGTSRSVPQPIGFDTSGSSRTGRTPVHQERVFEYMDRVLLEQGRVATFSEVEQELNLPQSTASRLRNDWREKNGYA